MKYPAGESGFGEDFRFNRAYKNACIFMIASLS